MDYSLLAVILGTLITQTVSFALFAVKMSNRLTRIETQVETILKCWNGPQEPRPYPGKKQI